MQYNEDIKKIVNRRKTKTPAAVEEQKVIEIDIPTSSSPTPVQPKAPSPKPASVLSQQQPPTSGQQSPTSNNPYNQKPI